MNLRLARLLLMTSVGTLSTFTACKTASDAATLEKPVSFERGVNISHFISQLGPRTYGDSAWFNASDLSWIANQGFDHIRLPLDGSLLFRPDGELDLTRLEVVDAVLQAARPLGLGVLLDLHELPGSDFSTTPDTRLFTSVELQDQAIRLWTEIATRYRMLGDELWFELLNEPVNDDAALVTAFYQRVIAAIRPISPDRKILVCANRWGSFGTVEALEPLLDDPHIIIDVHYYSPHVFTHQGASWVGLDHVNLPPISFPGVVPDISPYVSADHYAVNQIGKPLSVASVAEDFRVLAEWAKTQGVQIYVGEFGVYREADLESRIRWTRTILEQCDRHGFAWAVWDYKGGFALRNAQSGRPTDVFPAFDGFLKQGPTGR